MSSFAIKGGCSHHSRGCSHHNRGCIHHNRGCSHHNKGCSHHNKEIIKVNYFGILFFAQFNYCIQDWINYGP